MKRQKRKKSRHETHSRHIRAWESERGQSTLSFFRSCSLWDDMDMYCKVAGQGRADDAIQRVVVRKGEGVWGADVEMVLILLWRYSGRAKYFLEGSYGWCEAARQAKDNRVERDRVIDIVSTYSTVLKLKLRAEGYPSNIPVSVSHLPRPVYFRYKVHPVN